MYSHGLRGSATQSVYENLHHQIINIILEPGTKISKNEIAKQNSTQSSKFTQLKNGMIKPKYSGGGPKIICKLAK